MNDDVESELETREIETTSDALSSEQAQAAVSALRYGDDATATTPAARVFVRPGRVRPFYGRHPWVLDKTIARVEGTPADGDVVDLVDPHGKFIARGLYNGQSRLTVRLYTWDRSQQLDADFFRSHVSAAIDWRRQRRLLDDPEGGARIIFSEADGLSGLIVDSYAGWLAVQVTGLGLARRLNWILPALAEELNPQGIYIRTEKGTSQSEGLRLVDGLVEGKASDGPVFIHEHGLRYGVDVGTGQKTGFYLDQRENRLRTADFTKNARVLDVFCYTGGFALNASKRGGAREVLGIDGSDKAVATARANAELNGLRNLSFEAADAFDALDQLVARREKFDVVVLDPPKFARSRNRVDDALKAYHRINRLGVDLLSPGGILVTCSCSGHVQREDLLNMLGGVSQRTGRPIQVIEQRGAAVDHPISASCLETEYLKCMICRVV